MLVESEAVHSTLVVPVTPSVLVIVCQVSFHGVGVDVAQVTPVGRFNQTVELPEGMVMEQAQPSGQLVPVGLVALHKSLPR